MEVLRVYENEKNVLMEVLRVYENENNKHLQKEIFLPAEYAEFVLNQYA